MANIALVGATGNIGKKILDEALARGHRVTGTTRDATKLAARNGLSVTVAQPADTPALAVALKGHDVVIYAIRWDANSIDTAIETIRKSGVKRAIVVVGAGSLMRSDGRLHFLHMPSPPPSSKPAMLALDALKKIDDFDWTAISPPAAIKPGERTGVFRTDLDNLVIDAGGNSLISQEDFAIAILDEVEKPKHIRERFTVGY